MTLSTSATLFWIASGGAFSFEIMKSMEFFSILFYNFLVNMWEEIGWRGYTLPALQSRYSTLLSSLIVCAF